MFEKEAEDYSIDTYETCLYDNLPYVNDSRAREESFRDGAEFGYNKAKVEVEDSYRESLCNSECNLASVTEQLEELKKSNEWHKQSNDDVYDFIAEDWSVKHFICIMKDKGLVTATGNCDEDYDGEVSVNLVFDHDDEKYYPDDIVWWKEMVLPEEIKEK